MNKKLVALLMVGVMGMSLIACGQKSGESSSASSTTKPQSAGNSSKSSSGTKKIAYITPSLDLPYWRYLANGIENEVIDSGMNAKVQIYDSKNSNETQLQNAQDAIAQQSDIIIISPTDSSSCRQCWIWRRRQISL